LREILIQAGKDAKVQPWMQGVCQPEHLTDEQRNTTVGQIQLWRTNTPSRNAGGRTMQP
jgi:hypothetical protein